jgi:hypothetical protein
MLISLKRDIRPPTAPVLGVPVVLGTTSVSIPLTTAATDPNSVASYSLEYSTSLSGTYIEATAAAIFPQTVTGLTPSTQYFFRARAVDTYGNVGPYSGIVSATTQATTPSTDLTWPAHVPGYVSLLPEVGGYGMNTVAGSGRHLGTPATTVILVNSLGTGNTGAAVTGLGANVFAGTWEYAWRSNASPKVIIPIISGWVQIQSDITNQTGTAPRPGYVSYYGQFAPNPGLFLRGCNATINGASNVAVWHLRSYMGDDVTGVSAGARDCLSSGYGAGTTQSVILINCEFAWSVDELVDFFRSHNQISFVGCAFIEPLHISTIIHPEDGAGVDHGFGPIIGGSAGTDQSSAVSLFRNLWAHTTGRNPMVSAQTFVHANNLHYNHGRPTVGAGSGVQIIATGAVEANFANILGNGFVRGPNNNTSLVAVSVTGSYPTGSAGYAFANAQFGWTAPSSQNGFFTTAPTGYAAAAVQATAYPGSWGSGLGGVLQWASNPLAPTLTEWHNFVTLMEDTVGAQPRLRTSAYGRVQNVFDQIRNRLNGVTQTDQFVDTVTEAGGWFSVPSVTVDPLNPGSEWHGPLPTGSDRDTPYTSGTFSDGKSRVGYTRLEEWAYEQHLYVTTEQATQPSSNDYSVLDALTTDFYVDPARTTDGAGTEVSPFQPSQAFARNPNGQKLVFEWLPGNLDFTSSDPNSKFSRWHPLFSGTAANPIIHRARFKASNSATTAAQLTSIRRTGGAGSILGGLNTNHCWFDGFNIPTWTGSAGVENFQYSVWGCTGFKFTRGVIDGQSLGVAGTSTNCGGVWHQDIDDCVVADTIVRNIGNSSGSSLWSAFESYGAVNLQIYNCTVSNVHGFGIFEKGETTRFHGNRANRFFRNRISGIRRRALYSYVHHTGTSLSDATWWYQNLVYDVQEQAFFINPIVGLPPDDIFLPWSGVVVVNNVFAFCGFDGLAWRANGVPPISPEFAPIFYFYNNIFHGNTKNIGFEGATWATIASAAAKFDYNRYASYTTHFEDSGGTRTFASWDDLIGYQSQRNDEHGANASASFQDATNRDFRLATGSAARDAGVDLLGLLGGLTTAPINQGAYISSDMSDRIGCRTDL